MKIKRNSQDSEEPELTSPHKHIKITTIYRITIDEKDLNLPEKNFYN